MYKPRYLQTTPSLIFCWGLNWLFLGRGGDFIVPQGIECVFVVCVMSIILFCLSVRCVQLDFEFVLFVPSYVCMLGVLIFVARVDQMVCVSAPLKPLP